MWKFLKTPPVEKNNFGKNLGKSIFSNDFFTNECSNLENMAVENLFFGRFVMDFPIKTSFFQQRKIFQNSA